MTVVLVNMLEVAGSCPTIATVRLCFSHSLAPPERIWTNVGKSTSVAYRRDSAVVALEVIYPQG